MAHPGTGKFGADASGFQHALVDVHGNYRATRLSHEPPDELISDVVTARTLRPHLVRSGFFFAVLVVVSIVSFFTWLIALAVIVANSNSITGEGGGSGFVTTMAYLLLLVQFLVLVAWIIALFLPVREPIAEYGQLIEGRAQVPATAYVWIMNAMHGRQSPFTAQYAKFQGVPIILLVNGRDHGLVVVRSVGTDLYVGWTMWRARSTIVMIGHIFRDMFATDLAADVRAASGRALRELIHSVAREGVQAAILQPMSEDMARRQVDQLPSLDVPTGGLVLQVSGYQQVQPVQQMQTAQQSTQQWARPAQQYAPQPTQQYAAQPAAAQAYAQQSWAQPAAAPTPGQAPAPAPTPAPAPAAAPSSGPPAEAAPSPAPEAAPTTVLEKPSETTPPAEAPADAATSEARTEVVTTGDRPDADAPRPEAPQAGAPGAEAPEGGAPEAEAPKPEAPKPDAPKPDAPKPDAATSDAPSSGPPGR
jgi:hypothetical protein